MQERDALRSTLARRLLAVGIAIAVVTGLGAQAQAEPAQSTVAAHGENPSGKLNAEGKPLHVRPANAKPGAKSAVPAVVPPTECPADLDCTFIPAAYAQNSPDISDWGNYDDANRPANGLKVDCVVIHITEGSAQSALDLAADPTYYVSWPYLIKSNGQVVQTTPLKTVDWHAGNYYENQRCVAIEHEAHSVNGRVEFTPALIESSVKLVKHVAQLFNIPLDRAHIVGHDNVPAGVAISIPGMHWDAGTFWNWEDYMRRLGAPVVATGGYSSNMVTVAPEWSKSKLPVSDCSSGTCVTLPKQSTNFVYLRTQPSANAPLVTDPVLGAGTTAISNTAARAFYGQKFVVNNTRCDMSGRWYQIWYAGQLAWFLSPWGAPTAVAASGKRITPKPGVSSIPIYGRAYPEASAYPADFTGAPAVVALPYTISAGQKFAVARESVQTAYYYSWSFDGSLPYDRTVFRGNERYYQIFYNARHYYVKASDVVIG